MRGFFHKLKQMVEKTKNIKNIKAIINLSLCFNKAAKNTFKYNIFIRDNAVFFLS
jgi:nitrate reductase NapAB chaperone NapD